MACTDPLRLRLRRRVLLQDVGGHNCWRVTTRARDLPADRIAVVVCDVWNKHWSRGATERVDAMAPRINEVLRAARARGARIIHAPSDTMDFYAGTSARQRILDAPVVAAPKELDLPVPPLPVDASDGGSDTGEKPWYRAWTRQHPAIRIDQRRDGISDNGQEIYNFMQQCGVTDVLIMGVHTNMCVLGRSFGIMQMVKWGVNVALVRDLTDAMYNPAMPPYVSHEQGTRLVIEYIEKFWCPTIASADLVKE